MTMGDIASFGWQLAIGTLTAGAAGVVITLLSLGRPKQADGWTLMRPTLFLYGLSVLAIPLAILFFVFGTAGLAGPEFRDWRPHPRLIAAGMILMGLMFTYCAISTFAVQIRFNEDGVEKAWFWRRRLYPWTSLRRLKRSFFLGPVLVHDTGRIQVSEYLVGFGELALSAKLHGLEVDQEFVATS